MLVSLEIVPFTVCEKTAQLNERTTKRTQRTFVISITKKIDKKIQNNFLYFVILIQIRYYL